MDSNMKLTYSKFSQKLLISSKKGKKKHLHGCSTYGSGCSCYLNKTIFISITPADME